jgi:hypothetical protein
MKTDVQAETLKALEDLLETLQWLQDSGNLKSPIEPHPFGLGVIMAKQQARSAIANARAKGDE